MSDVADEMGPGRLNAFTDGVLAIIITIMVLELPVPHGDSWAALEPELPLFAAYALSFVNVGIFWVNHHHMFHLAKVIDGRVLLANLFLLFWLSLVPFVIRWVGEEGISEYTVAAYGVVLVMASLAYMLIERTISSAEHGPSKLDEALGEKRKEIVSVVAYFAAVPLAFFFLWASIGIYLVVALYWLIPDRRVEKVIPEGGQS